ncbi:universal stress protein [Reichenbachiella ulvae]|uniref:Universal stress protein n=1 Tax=Reichenbachiella ulvae TaxID=2980104 RepID=A0ABT3CSM0_9BACT|nr:universal stress protein [Reichenbachiella ulvae]MCV9386248.1 universal stress protein [Reichenbachiella ulvae]
MKPNLLNILVPTDFSEASKTAVRLAIKWSADLKAKVTIVHAYRLIKDNQGSQNLDPRELKAQVESRCRQKFEVLQQEIDFSKAYEYSFRLELGFINNSIKNLSKEYKPSLVLYGTKPERMPHSYDNLLKIVKDNSTTIALVNEAYNSEEAETMGCLEKRSIFCTNTKFIDNPEHQTRKIERAHNNLLFIHSEMQSPKEIIEHFQPVFA